MRPDQHSESAATRSSPKVVFIGGYGRSGSTLLDRVLGSIEGLVSAGELSHLWRDGCQENRPRRTGEEGLLR
jgi:hypothetical protein